MWNSYKKGFVMHLQLEKSLSQNTVEAYTLDLDKLIQFTILNRIEGGPESLTLVHLQSYIHLSSLNFFRGCQWFWSRFALGNAREVCGRVR